MSSYYVCWSSLGEINGEGEEVLMKANMLGAKSWMVRTQKTLELEAGEKKWETMVQKRGENIELWNSG